MRNILIITFATLLAFVILVNDTTVLVKKTKAQRKGSITGKVFLREKPKDGPGSLLIKIDNECKKYPCQSQGVNEVRVTFDGINYSDQLEMPSIPKFEDTKEYKEFIRTLEEMRELEELEELERREMFPFRVWGPFRYPDPPIRQSFFDNSFKGKVEKEKDKLIIRFTYGYPPEKFDPPEGLRARVTIPDNLFEQLQKKKASVEVSDNNNKVIFRKKLKPEKLPKIEVEQKVEQESFLPNALVPGKPAYASFNSDYAVGKFGKGPQIKQSGNLVLRLIVKGVKFGIKNSKKIIESGKKIKATVHQKTVYGVGSIPVTPGQLRKTSSSDKNKTGQTEKKPSSYKVGSVRSGQVFLLPPVQADPEEVIGVTIFNEFGEEISDIVFPEIKIVKPDPDGKNKNGNSDSDDNSPDKFPKSDEKDRLDSEDAPRIDEDKSENDKSGKGNEPKTGRVEPKGDKAGNCKIGISDVAKFALEGRRICACGCFFNNLAEMRSIFSSFMLDGKPISPAACSPVTASFELPPNIKPGVHKLTYKGADGKSETVEFRVIGIIGDIDTDRLWLGQGTTMTLKIVGTDEPLPLTIRNLTSSIITLSEGNQQTVKSSGGPTNQIQQQLVGISKGDFIIDYSLDLPPCPCYQDIN